MRTLPEKFPSVHPCHVRMSASSPRTCRRLRRLPCDPRFLSFRPRVEESSLSHIPKMAVQNGRSVGALSTKAPDPHGDVVRGYRARCGVCEGVGERYPATHSIGFVRQARFRAKHIDQLRLVVRVTLRVPGHGPGPAIGRVGFHCVLVGASASRWR